MAPAAASHHCAVGTPTNTSSEPAANPPSRTSARRRVASSSRVFSSAAVKCALHTITEWVMAPSATRCTISQVDSGIHRWVTATTTAASSQTTNR